MRISDWSSDVCSSDLIWCTRDLLTHWGAAEIISTTPEEVRSDLSDEDGVLSDHCMERIARARRILQQDEQTYLARLASVTASVGEPEQEDGQPRPCTRSGRAGKHVVRDTQADQIGTASCRERVCQDGLI